MGCVGMLKLGEVEGEGSRPPGTDAASVAQAGSVKSCLIDSRIRIYRPLTG